MSVNVGHGEWVVVCDGAKALILENAGDEKFPNLKTREVYAQEDPPTRELGTDRPGRSVQSAARGGRSAMEQTDWHARSEQAFLETLAKTLEKELQAGLFKSLVICAPPKALGVLRQALTPQLKQAVRAEIDKDLVKIPVHEIEKHLKAA
jgi:protein required for attachment to host cells